MTRSCILKCKNKGVPLHRFPEDPKKRVLWQATVRKYTNISEGRKQYLCSTHFKKELFDPSGRLRDKAIPTIFESEVLATATAEHLQDHDYQWCGERSKENVKAVYDGHHSYAADGVESLKRKWFETEAKRDTLAKDLLNTTRREKRLRASLDSIVQKLHAKNLISQELNELESYSGTMCC